MAGAYTNVNLSQLAPPTIIAPVDFDAELAALLAEFQARVEAAGGTYTAPLESDPVYKLAEAFTYRLALKCQEFNDRALGLLLAYAMGTDLDQLGANVNVARNLISPADNTTVPPTPAVYESDDDFRARIQLSFEGFTTAGSEGSYVFHGLSADGDVKDVSAVSPSPGVVDVYVLSRTGDGTASADLVAAVNAALSAENVRPMTDQVTVQSAGVVTYTIDAELTMYPGPDAQVVLAAALAAAQKYANDMHRIGFDVARSGVMAALHQPGVQAVNLTSPAADIPVDDTQASYCTAFNVTVASGTNV